MKLKNQANPSAELEKRINTLTREIQNLTSVYETLSTQYPDNYEKDYYDMFDEYYDCNEDENYEEDDYDY